MCLFVCYLFPDELYSAVKQQHSSVHSTLYSATCLTTEGHVNDLSRAESVVGFLFTSLVKVL